MKRITRVLEALILMAAVVFAAGCAPETDPTNQGGNNNGENGGNTETHEYVDLGLPSGTLWATCNVGATTPEDYGDFYAWGETTPKTTYDWNTYKYCNDGNPYQLTKYCTKYNCGYNGFTDNLITLWPTDDAATANWGNGWCMPTSEQWDELYQNTSQTWTTLNSANGRLFIASNGNSLFLPAAGLLYGDELIGTGNTGLYWSSSLTNPSYSAWSFYYYSDSDSYGRYDYPRYNGQSIRPVRSAR